MTQLQQDTTTEMYMFCISPLPHWPRVPSEHDLACASTLLLIVTPLVGKSEMAKREGTHEHYMFRNSDSEILTLTP